MEGLETGGRRTGDRGHGKSRRRFDRIYRTEKDGRGNYELSKWGATAEVRGPANDCQPTGGMEGRRTGESIQRLTRKVQVGAREAWLGRGGGVESFSAVEVIEWQDE